MWKGLSARAGACATAAVIGLLTLGGVSARAAANPCASGETAVGSYTTLQTDLAAAPENAIYCLTASLADSAATPGGLVVTGANGNIGLDLNGYSLTITHPGTATPGITVGSGLILQDNSAAQTGSLTVTGGNASSTAGGGAGIDGYVAILGGTVHATGGSADTGATNASGAGAGIGGNGGSPGNPGGTPYYFEMNGGTLVATGGASDATSQNDGGSGAGIGGGGGGSGAAGGGTGDDYVDGGTITATGGASESSAGNDAGAGAGIGGGGGGSASAGGSVSGLSGYGGTISVTAGRVTGTASGLTAPAGFGDGGGTGGGTYVTSSRSGSVQAADFAGGTTTISGQWSGNIAVDSGAELDVAAGASLTLSQPNAGGISPIVGTLGLPASSTLDIGENEDFSLEPSGTETLYGRVNLTSASGDVDVSTAGEYGGAGDLTLADPGTFDGPLGVANGITLTIPAGQTLDLSSPNNDNFGTIDLAGELTGSGALDNGGAIILDGSGASIPGHGQGPLAITGNAYDLQFSVPAPGTAPADEYVYADTLADDDDSLPAEPAVSGYETDGGWTIGNRTQLSPDATNGVVPVSGLYVADDSISSNESFSYGAPTEATITTGDSDTDVATIYPASGAPTASGYETPTGTVTFYVCGPSTIVAYCDSTSQEVGSPVTLTGGADSTATATSPAFTATAAGYYCFNAVYSGDPFNGASSDGSTVSQCFYAGAAGTEVSTPTASQPETTEGQPVLLSTTVANTASSSVPDSGQVTFFVNGTETLCIAEVIDGQASCQTSGLPTGTDSITARYEGNAGFSQSAVSGALQEIVAANNAFSVERVASLRKANAVAVALKLPNSGTVRVALSSGRYRVLRTGTVTLARTARSKTVTIEVKLAQLERSLLHGRAGTVQLKVAVTYTPRGGTARTVVRRIRVRVARTATA
jgi:hypothetical protein